MIRIDSPYWFSYAKNLVCIFILEQGIARGTNFLVLKVREGTLDSSEETRAKETGNWGKVPAKIYHKFNR